jgi:HEAT repeat protein
MAAKRKQIKRDPFRLNEPAARIAGGSRRSSVVEKGGAFARIRDRERLYGVLLQHDPDDHQPHLTARDMGVLRLIATEGPLANHVPAIRRNAILLLATSPTPENLEVLAELAVTGEDFYVRSHALLALGGTGLRVTAHLLRDALSASESTERQAAEAGLRLLARRVGPGILRILRETERDDSRRAVLDRVLGGLNEQRPKRRPPRQTAARKRARTGG